MKDLWNTIGIYLVIESVLDQDKAGSRILEILLRQDSQNLPGFSILGQKEVIAFSCWYLWWIRQRRAHNETVPSMMNCKMSILSMVANAAKLSNRWHDSR
jgi:hypothetical protein